MSGPSSPFRRPKGKGGTKSALAIDEGAFELKKSKYSHSRNEYNVDPHHRFVEVRIYTKGKF